MDELCRDPELAPEFVKFLSAKLKETRTELDESRKEIETLRAENAQLRQQKADAFMGETVEPGKEEMHRQLRLREEIENLHRASIEHEHPFREESLEVVDENHRPHEEHGRRRVRFALLHSTEDRRPLKSCLARPRLAQNDNRALQQATGALRRQHLADQEDMLQQEEEDLDTRLSALAAKKQKYKKKLGTVRKEVRSLKKHAQFPRNAVERPEQPPKSAVDEEPDEGDDDDDDDCSALHQRNGNVDDARSNSLDGRDSDQHRESGEGDEDDQDLDMKKTPCLNPGHVPGGLPLHIKQLSKASAGFLFWPGRTLYPYGKGSSARIYACMSKCDTSVTPFVWTPANHNLSRLVGSTRELFHQVESGVVYLGMYRCVRAGQCSAAKFRQLPEDIRLRILKHSLPREPGSVPEELSVPDRDAILRAYDDGQRKVEYLQLEFIEFNRAYFNALIKFKEQDQSAHGAKTGAKRKRDENPENGPTKRTRK